MKSTNVGSSNSKGIKSSTGTASIGAASSSSSHAAVTDNKTSLLARLHNLISNLTDATNAVKNWPSSHDDQVHYDATTNLIQSLHRVVDAVKEVEDRVGKDGNNTKPSSVAGHSILDAPVVLDLLDLMDYGNGLNPEIFIKQLIREALRQLSGLKRRKQALGMLGQAIENGLKDMELKDTLEIQLAEVARCYSTTGETSESISTSKLKRLREEGDKEDLVTTDTKEQSYKKLAL
jgi:hypothetical protein